MTPIMRDWWLLLNFGFDVIEIDQYPSSLVIDYESKEGSVSRALYFDDDSDNASLRTESNCCLISVLTSTKLISNLDHESEEGSVSRVLYILIRMLSSMALTLGGDRWPSARRHWRGWF